MGKLTRYLREMSHTSLDGAFTFRVYQYFDGSPGINIQEEHGGLMDKKDLLIWLWENPEEYEAMRQWWLGLTAGV